MVRLQNLSLVVLSAIVFGSLMAFRETLDNIWWRAIVAAMAFGCWALMFAWLWRKRTAN